MKMRNGLWLAAVVALSGLSLKAADAPAGGDVLTISVPGGVRETLIKETGSAEILEFHRDHDGNAVRFVAGVMIKDRKYDITVDDAGRLLSKDISDEDADAIAATTGSVKAEALPNAVKAALDKEVHGGKVESASVLYEVKAAVDQGTYNLKFAGDGTLLSKELDDNGN